MPRTVVSLTAAALLIPSVALAEGHKLTVEEAVQMAEERNTTFRGYQTQLEGQRDLQKAAGGRMLVSGHLTDEYQHWNEPFAIAFGPQSFTVREGDTNTFTATADQPILGLGHLTHEYKAQESTVKAAEADVETARADLRRAVDSYYVQLFEARALEQIAKASEDELAEQVSVADAKLKAGTFTTADVLRVKVSQANAKQQEIQAHTQAEVARANILGVVGLPMDDGSIDFAEPSALLAEAKAPLPSATLAQSTAQANRPELRHQRMVAESSHHTASAKAWSLLPDFDLEGGWLHFDGQPFNPKNAEYVGVKAQWAVWEWGASFYTHVAAGAAARAQDLETRTRQREIEVEVATDLAQAASAAAAVDVAEQTIVSAEEAYRVTKALLQAGTATTTDLLDAQKDLTQARLSLTRAEYDQALARVTLKRGMGTL